ncbi:hypothetical protein ACI3KT_14405 [Microbacterium sp. ZW T6_19]|uniref:hypothetical protein n=1 Tax=Microbacterium sp. ZW T6_19 TaxID=3378082 RepID=UPI003853E516
MHDRVTGILTKTAALAALSLLLTACSATHDGARAELDKHAAVVDDAAQDVLQALDAADLSDAGVAGYLEQCGGSLTGWGVAYHAGGSAKVGEDRQAAVEDVAAELESLGWAHEGEIGGDDPSARLTRDDLTIDLKTGGFTVGATRYGADELEIGIRQSNACVETPEGEYKTDYAEFEREILPRE